MAAEIKTLSPAHVWSYFYDLTQIPRPTFHTEAVQEYLLALAKRLNLEAQHDATGNILIRKPATPGLEGRPVVTLQAHIDMVPQKNSHIEHDFTKDPIDAYIDGEWVTARDTTLGADNGIGAAYMMAVLSDDTLKHGPLEALFTVDEEVGMVGANGLASLRGISSSTSIARTKVFSSLAAQVASMSMLSSSTRIRSLRPKGISLCASA